MAFRGAINEVTGVNPIIAGVQLPSVSTSAWELALRTVDRLQGGDNFTPSAIAQRWREADYESSDLMDGVTRSGKRFRPETDTSENTSNKRQRTMAREYAQEDVKVVPPPKQISVNIPDYFTVRLPYYMCFEWGDSVTAKKFVYSTFRLNGISGVFKTPADATLRVADHLPHGAVNWSQIYQYYRVLHSDWKFTFISKSSSANDYLIGYESGQEGNPGPQTCTQFVENKQSHHVIMPSRDKANIPSVATMSYHYDPSKWSHHVNLTNREDYWDQFNVAPEPKHELRLYAFNSEDNTTTNWSIKVIVEAIFTIQARELEQTKRIGTDTTFP